MVILAGLGKVYAVGQVYRSEPSQTSRPATEFQGLDIKMEGEKSESELVALKCEMLRAAIAKTLTAMGPELAAHYPKATLPGSEKVLTFAEAQVILGISGPLGERDAGRVAVDRNSILPSNGGRKQTMTTLSCTFAEQKSLPIPAGAVTRVVRNDNDSNPFPGWDRCACRN